MHYAYVFILLYNVCLLQNVRCGKNSFIEQQHHRVKRIIEEERCKFERYPYVVAILKNVVFETNAEELLSGQNRTCTGTLLNSKTVLTTASCTINAVLVAGTWDLLLPVSKIELVIRHPKYILGDLYHNIAILKLQDGISSNNTYPMLRPQILNLEERCQTGVILGFGAFSNRKEVHPLTSKLPCAAISVMEQSECVMKMRGLPENNYAEIFCGKAFDASELTMGDAGAPLICNQDLIGIVSWLHQEGADWRVPESDSTNMESSGDEITYVFTRVDVYMYFIKEYMQHQPEVNKKKKRRELGFDRDSKSSSNGTGHYHKVLYKVRGISTVKTRRWRPRNKKQGQRKQITS